jgi:hypothetical protein
MGGYSGLEKGKIKSKTTTTKKQPTNKTWVVAWDGAGPYRHPHYPVC